MEKWKLYPMPNNKSGFRINGKKRSLFNVIDYFNSSLSRTPYLALLTLLLVSISACDSKNNSTQETLNNDTGFITQGNISSVSDGKNVLVNAWASSITATEVDGQTPSFVILHNSNPTLFSKQPIVSYPEGSLSFTTRLGSSGTASIDVILQQANDGEFIPSEIVSFDIVIESELINLAPEFSLGNDLIIEDSSHAFEQANWLTVAHDGNDSDQQLTFDTIENSAPNLFVVEPWISYPSRTLRFTPVPGSIGTAIITIRARDNGGSDNGGVDTSEHQTFRITFLEQSSNINHHPEFVVGEDITVMRNSADFERKAWVNSVSDGDDDTQPLHFVISANDSPHLFTDQPWVSYPSKTLRFTPKAGVTGTAILSIYVRETHGNLRSSTQTFKIHIVANSQNLSPTFTLGPNVVVAMNSGDAAFPAWATKIDDANHGNGKIGFEIVSVEKTYLFSEQPNISIPSGTLRFRPADNKFGMSHVSVRLKDLNDPQASSETVTFSITIKAPQETNRAPVASAGSHTLQESSSITFALQASDEDGDSLIYKIVDAPTLAVLY